MFRGGEDDQILIQLNNDPSFIEYEAIWDFIKFLRKCFPTIAF